MLSQNIVLLLLPCLFRGSLGYIWGTDLRYDSMEDIYTVTGGFLSSGLLDEVTFCQTNADDRSTAAHWLRGAYHDSATHNTFAGTGGVDASLQFETNRVAQNPGAGISDALNDFTVNAARFRSVSDIFAVGTALAIKACGGPQLTIPTGRVDATVAGPSTVPQPEQPLSMFQTQFTNQGYSATEMIELVTCGHTIGGVHQVDFPGIVQGQISGSNPEGTVDFGLSTDSTFDNHLAVETKNGNTQNPLFLTANVTLRSDAKVFNSDGLVTINNLAATNSYFQTRCAAVLSKMLNLVPSTVTLSSSPLAPAIIKPTSVRVQADTTGPRSLSGYIRLFRPTTFNPSSARVLLTWAIENGGACPFPSFCGINATYDATKSSTSLWGTVAYYHFDTTTEIGPNFVFPNTGVSGLQVSYCYDVNTASTCAFDNNGGGNYPVQDLVTWNKAGSLRNAGNIKVVAAIRANAGTITNPQVIFYSLDRSTSTGANTFPVKVISSTHTLTLLTAAGTPGPAGQAHALYSTTFAMVNGSSFDIVATIGGVTTTLFDIQVSEVSLGL